VALQGEEAGEDAAEANGEAGLTPPAEDPAATTADLVPAATTADPVPPATAADLVPSPRAAGAWFSGVLSNGRRPSSRVVTAVAAAAVIVIAVIAVAVSGSSHKTTASAANSNTLATRKKKAEPVTVVSVSPANGSTGVNGAAPVTVTYSGTVTKDTPLPTLSPSIAGSWQTSGDKAIFTPQVGFTEDTHVTVTIPASAGITTTTAATTFKFTTGKYSMLRLDQLLSQLGYIPVSWTPASPSGDVSATDAGAQLSAAYAPPPGTFSFDSGYPHALTSMWSAGSDNEIIDGAVRSFEYDQNLTMDGDPGPQVWKHLLNAVTKDQRNQHGYTYVWVTQAGDEHLDLYHDGKLAITSPINTGIAAASTADGTFPVYLRYTVTQMQGNNPDGTPYNDTVYWVSYFNGGDAVHAFPRPGYGWYQSLGCVELPYNGSGPGVAENVWNLITYGTLVTVTGPVA
jgi:L,D-transpeptidase catalytic domain/Bacterial Ig-like domain